MSAQDKLNACAPFIAEMIYTEYSELEGLCKTQLSDFQDFRLRPDAKDYIIDCMPIKKRIKELMTFKINIEVFQLL